MEDVDASELIAALAGPAGLVLFLLALGWAAIERGSVHAYVRQQWRFGSNPAGWNSSSVLDDVLEPARRDDEGSAHQVKEHSGWHRQH